MLNPWLYLAILGIIFIVTAVATTVIVAHGRHKIDNAVKFAVSEYRRYRQSGEYPPLSCSDAQQICRKLFTIPEHYWSDTDSIDRFWWDDYAKLIELAIALGTDPQNQVYLSYGTFEENIRFKYRREIPFRPLLWLEFRYDDKKWVFWYDAAMAPATNDPDLPYSCHPYDMFLMFGKVRNYNFYPTKFIINAYQECLQSDA